MYSGKQLVLFTLTLLLLIATGCGQGGQTTGAPGAAQQPEDSGLPAGLQAIPALTGLPATEREASILGPGWTAVPPQEAVSTGNASLGPDTALTLNAVAGMAYAVYGITGFDGDNGPTSARVTISSIIGQYYIGFSDYVAGTWRFAGPFTGSASAEIPLPSGAGSSDYLSPRAFTSPEGTCYFTVALAAGSLVVVTGVELGVHGGVLGPATPSFTYASGGAAGCQVHWQPSPDFADPDFAGYILERAPLLYGDFAQLGGGEIDGEYYMDMTAVMDVEYRYRVCAVDASGNRSPWATGTGGPVTGNLVPPVPVLHLPRGPLQTPAQVTLDLSDSYDPEGVGITDYTFVFIVYPETHGGPNPTYTVNLPPGCHAIGGQVTTGDGRISSVTAYLKVYPGWSSTPSVVATPDPTATLTRLNDFRAALQPGTTRPVIFGPENATRSCTAYYQFSNGGFRTSRLPLFDPINFIGEPVILHNAVIFPCSSGDLFQLAIFERNALRWLRPGVYDEGFGSIAAGLTPDEVLRLFVAQDNAGQIDLMAFDISTPGAAGVVIVPNIVTLIGIDVAYNAASNNYDIVYSTAAATEWVRWDPATNIITASGTLAALPSPYIDVEQHPLTGRPGVARFDTMTMRWLYTELDATLTWIPDEIINNTGVNQAQGDLVYGNNGNAFIYFAVAPGQAYLHERSAPPAWTVRNTPAYAAVGGYDVALMNLPGTDSFLCVDRVAGNSVVVAELTAAPAENVIWTLPAFQGLLGNIQGAAATIDTTYSGSEVLHVLFTDSFLGNCNHYTSSNHGAVWSPEAVTSFTFMDVGATRDGGLYVTNNVVLNHELHFWDPVANAFLLYTTAVGTSQPTFLSCGMASADARWFSFDDVNMITYTSGHFGVVPTVNNFVADSVPVWTGGADMAGFSTVYGILASGATVDAASLHWSPAMDGSMNFLSDTLVGESFETYSMPPVKLKQVATCSYYASGSTFGLLIPSTAIWSTYGNLLDAQRLDVNAMLGNSITPLLMDIDFTQDEPRRSVTAACAAGWTAVGLVAALDGSSPYFEWSNYGNWERLEMPPALAGGACNPELIVGRDGAWHIVYWDWPTDRVMCLNSL